MIKVILFDCDGLIIRHEKYFSVRLAESKGIKADDENQEQKEFFNGIFLDCEVGKADLKQALTNNLSIWDWPGSVEGLMDYWFSGEANVENDLKNYILSLREKGMDCFLTTNNEKYRMGYLWNAAGLKNIFNGFFSSGDIGNFKEDRVFWEKVFKNFTYVNKSEILVWDDDQDNVNSAKDFGFNAEFYKGFESFKQITEQKYKITA